MNNQGNNKRSTATHILMASHGERTEEMGYPQKQSATPESDAPFEERSLGLRLLLELISPNMSFIGYCNVILDRISAEFNLPQGDRDYEISVLEELRNLFWEKQLNLPWEIKERVENMLYEEPKPSWQATIEPTSVHHYFRIFIVNLFFFALQTNENPERSFVPRSRLLFGISWIKTNFNCRTHGKKFLSHAPTSTFSAIFLGFIAPNQRRHHNIPSCRESSEFFVRKKR